VQGPNIAGGASMNALNQVSSFNGQAFVYDANGNLLSDGARTYTWDAADRLLSIGYAANPAWSTAFRYDGLGRRIAVVTTNDSGTTETRYLWCGDSICQSRDGTDTVTRRYYPEGELIPGAGVPMFYAQDQQGSVRDVLAADGSTAASYDYDPYGNLIQSAGPASTGFRYGRLLYDPTSGLYLAEYRGYDPVTGRWLSLDPIREEGGINLYAYANDNPANYVDPNGQMPLLLALPLIGGLIDAVFSGVQEYRCSGDWTQALKESVVGFVSGFTATGVAMGMGLFLTKNPFIIGGYGAGTENAVHQFLDHQFFDKEYNGWSFLASTGAGVALGPVGEFAFPRGPGAPPSLLLNRSWANYTQETRIPLNMLKQEATGDFSGSVVGVPVSAVVDPCTKCGK
jgi:RHS repeat-associated protein